MTLIPESYVGNIIAFFKATEWLFMFCVIWFAANVTFSRKFFEAAIKFLNWLIKHQGLNGTVTATEKGYQQYHRDVWILLTLKILIVILIEML